MGKVAPTANIKITVQVTSPLAKNVSMYLPSRSGSFIVCRLIISENTMFLLGLLPHFFSIPNIGNGLYITAMMVPYLMATSFFGLAASRFFTDSEAPLLMIAFFSVGLIFLSGVSYPLELMPWYWRMMHYIIPAAPATLAFVKLNSMGADMGVGCHHRIYHF
jgi:ABC-2 type transport system permease protein